MTLMYATVAQKHHGYLFVNMNYTGSPGTPFAATPTVSCSMKLDKGGIIERLPTERH
jgi:hypothetical protein